MPTVEFPKATNTAGMLFACWAIVIVIALMFFVFMRAKKKEYALGILPLMLLPFVHLFSAILANGLDGALSLPVTPSELRVIIDMTAGLVSCLLIGLTSRRIDDKATRNLFAWGCSIFLIILTLVLVANTMVSARV